MCAVGGHSSKKRLRARSVSPRRCDWTRRALEAYRAQGPLKGGSLATVTRKRQTKTRMRCTNSIGSQRLSPFQFLTPERATSTQSCTSGSNGLCTTLSDCQVDFRPEPYFQRLEGLYVAGGLLHTGNDSNRVCSLTRYWTGIDSSDSGQDQTLLAQVSNYPKTTYHVHVSLLRFVDHTNPTSLPDNWYRLSSLPLVQDPGVRALYVQFADVCIY